MPSKRDPDAKLIATCARFSELDEEITRYNIDRANERGDPPPHPREAKHADELARLCRLRATTLDGIAARVRILLRWESR